MSALHPATDADVARVWPLARSRRIAGTADEFARLRDGGLWRVQVTPAGEAVVLDRWRAHMDVCAILGAWAPGHETARLIADVAGVARAQGFSELLSPLEPMAGLTPYLEAGMAVRERIVALQAPSGLVCDGRARPGVSIRGAQPADITEILAIDAQGFDEFWRYGHTELLDCLARERVVVAEGPWGELLGYSTCTVRSGTATLGRLAVRESARGRGMGLLLVGEAARWAERVGAVTFTLCTQLGNCASRALYARAGMTEVAEEYALASMMLPSRGAPLADTL